MIKTIIYSIFILISNLSFLLIFNRKEKKKVYFTILMTIISIMICLIVKGSFTFFCLIYLINNIILILMNKNTKKKIIKKIIFNIFILLSISIFAELTLFNYRSYLSFFYDNMKVEESNIKTNMKKVDDSTYYVETEEPYIEIKNINKKVNNIYLDITNSINNTYYVIPYITDSGNQLYQRLESRELCTIIEKSKTLNFNISGKSKKIKLEFTFPKDTTIKVNNIIINHRIPIKANIIRICLLFTVLLFIYLLGPKSILYDIKYVDLKKEKLLLLGLILTILCSFSFLSVNSIKSIKSPKGNIYTSTSNRLIEKKVYLKDLNNSEELLKKMKNPYDTNLREKIFKDNNKEYMWDCAFYKGKYYSYFGIVPAILFYIPFKLTTGDILSTPFLVYVLSIISGILLLLLLRQIVKKYFRKCSVGLYIILSLLLVYGTGLLYCLKMPDQYIIPIISGLMFTYLGLNLFISALNNKYKTLKLFLGALSFALVAGCRPQLLVGSFLLLPIGYLYFKEQKRNKKEIVLDALTILIPYVVIAILLMYYNYIRFESPFDFGANYNLTTNDMTSRGFKLDRIPLGIVMYLFNPVSIKNVFPFITETEFATTYLGVTIYEPLYGGVLFSSIITMLNLFIFRLKKYMKSKVVFNTCILLIISSVLVIIADTEMAGILARYINDFLWLLIFSSILIILSINNNNSINKKVFLEVIFILISITLLYQGFYFFVSIIDKFKSQNLRFWLEFYYLIQFWL